MSLGSENKNKVSVEENKHMKTLSAESLSPEFYDQIDLLDEDAVRRWHTNVSKNYTPNNMIVPAIKALKISKLFAAYGSKDIALVNRANNKHKLRVERRGSTERRQER